MITDHVTTKDLEAILRDHLEIVKHIDRWEAKYPHIHLRCEERRDLILRLVYFQIAKRDTEDS
jgi:hypothetical protein